MWLLVRDAIVVVVAGFFMWTGSLHGKKSAYCKSNDEKDKNRKLLELYFRMVPLFCPNGQHL